MVNSSPGNWSGQASPIAGERPGRSFASAPRLDLPKGGGAIRSIGEKFAANSVTGTGSMSVPIPTSPGRSGFGPQLSLSYDSGAGNGPFGIGWSLSLPSIARKTEGGLPRYVDDEESDVFVLSGTEDLVPECRKDAVGAWVRDADGHPVVHEDETDGWRVRRYRPRVEGLFARIERWTRIDDPADTHWRALSRDNILTIYGEDPESRIFDPIDPRRIFGWLICQSRDDRGNAVLYRYKAEDGEGVDAAHPGERNRGGPGDPRRASNRFLKRIHYGNPVPLLEPDGSRPRFLDREEIERQIDDGEWMFEVVLDYGEHDADSPGPGDSGAWTYRSDPFSSYRSGFELRTTRLCRRILMFHHFEEEAGIGRDCLINSVDIGYAEENDPTAPADRAGAMLSSVTQRGYRRNNGGYDRRSLPPVEFRYSQAVVQDRLEEIEPDGLDDLPAALDGRVYRWVDLHGEGLPGIVAEQDGAWFYKRNLSPLAAAAAEQAGRSAARFAPFEPVGRRPNASLAEGAELTDLGGDGRADLVVLQGSAPGFYEHDESEGWRPFRPFEAPLNRDLADPNLRFVDLDGDGRADVLITEDEAFLWYASLAGRGFGPARKVIQAMDEERGPRLVFADRTEAIYVADFSGDGLADIARVRNGEVCYWPNLGHGRFGAKVTMAASPWFDNPDRFDHRRIRLADIDGSGTTDIIYLGADSVRIYFNRSGNGWSPARPLTAFPRIDDLANVAAVDLLGNGTACLVWSSPLPQSSRRRIRFVNLVGRQKPHLLVATVNNLGGETLIDYSPSTKFYLQDKAAGRPWRTRLPFPVAVVERVVALDHVRRSRFVTRYAYHHGHFDGPEREFRGFGMVEQWDSESFEDYVEGVESFDGLQELAPQLNQPVVTTRTWYHTGGGGPDGSRFLHPQSSEYYGQKQHIPEPALPAGLEPDELREGLRALKGLPLRREVYSFDGSARELHPYTVSETNFEIRMLQPRGRRRHGVFFPVGRESISFSFERDPADPRISHDFELDVDDRGNVLKSCSVVYGRKLADPALPAAVTAGQRRRYVTYSEADFTDDLAQDGPAHSYRLGVPFDTRSYEITGIAPAAALFRFDEIRDAIAATAQIDYEIVASGADPERRLLARGVTRFLDNGLNPLPPGEWDTLGLRHQSYELAFTPGVIAAHFAGVVDDAGFEAAGYVHLGGDDNWWIPSGTALYPADPAKHFFLPAGSRDPFGLETLATYDRYDLLIEKVEVVQAGWNVVSAVNDYRVLAPVLITDPNGNRSAVLHDELGMVVRTAVMGKAGSADGDSLADPTSRMEYELFNWVNNRKPNFVHFFAREKHGAANPRWQESFAYSNGSGGVALVKAQAPPGKALRANEDGTVSEVDADPRWIGNGRTVLNNKGKAVKSYQPYFSTTHEYEDEKALREIGAAALHFYDPVGRPIRTLFPDGTLSRVEFDSWRQKSFDANDTVLESDWYAARGSPDPASDPEPLNDPARRAAWLAARHSGTPAVTHFDSLGRAAYAVSDYGGGETAAVRHESDLTGRYTATFDQLQRPVAGGFVAMSGATVMSESAERGVRRVFHDVSGAMVRSWDEHGRQFRVEYDDLRRPVATFVQDEGAEPILFNYVVYGDRLADAADRNLLGASHRLFDQAGLISVPAMDFKGNPVSIERVLARDYKDAIDWTSLHGQPDPAAVDAAAAPLLELGEVFAAASKHDALNRPVEATLPDGTIIQPVYDEANMLASLKARIRGAGPFVDFLEEQDYDARGQRQSARYGNGLLTRYFYDADNFRLTDLVTFKPADDPGTEALQALHYTYDPVGNVTGIADDAQQTRFFANAVVKPECRYEYDALYQLIRASGRELAGLGNDSLREEGDLDGVSLQHVNDAAAVRTYSEEYEYDLLGNITALKHRFQPQPVIGNGWTRHYRYAFESAPGDRTNRLVATSRPGDPGAGPYTGTFDHDDYGNMIRMPHLAALDWDFMDRLRRVDLGGGGTAYHVHGASGRVRKVIERPGNLNLEWIFLGAVRIFRHRRRDTEELRMERWSVDLGDNSGNFAQVDTKTLDEDGADPATPLGTPLIRYRYTNHLGSAVLETDEAGSAISYEEYHPFGTTAYRSAKPGFGLSLKRYRFSGKERDDETGLYYFGVRYYAPWLARWTSSDPAGQVDGLNLYVYCGNDPVGRSDPTGTQSQPLSPVGEVSWSLPSNLFLDTTTGQRYTDAQVLTNVSNYLASQGKRYTPGTLEISRWENRTTLRGTAYQVPIVNAEWLDANGQPLLPRRGDFGNVAPMRRQPRAEYGTPGNAATRLTEGEHSSPGGQNRAVDPDYTPNVYRNDAVVRSPRGVSLDKTRIDNQRTTMIQQRVAAGQPVNPVHDIDVPSNENFHRANEAARAAGRPHIRNPGSINRGTLEQMGGRFERGRSNALPTGAAIEEPNIAPHGAPPAAPSAPSAPRMGPPGGGWGGIGRGVGTGLARALVPGFVEAEMAAVVAPQALLSMGVTNSTALGIAQAAAAAPTTFAVAVTAPLFAGAAVGNVVESGVTSMTGSREAGVGAAVAASAGVGAVIGTFVPIPGVGTAAGAAIGAGIGLVGYGLSRLLF